MAVVHNPMPGFGIATIGSVGFSNNKLTHGIESRRLPHGHKAIHPIPVAKADYQRAFFEDAGHLQGGSLQPLIRHIPGNLASLMVFKSDQVQRFSDNKVNSAVGEYAHHINTVPRRTPPVHRIRLRARPIVEYHSRQPFRRREYAAKRLEGRFILGRGTGVKYQRRRAGAEIPPVPFGTRRGNW